jgi:hypothetical protein
MILKNIILAWLNVVACVAVALALVIFPPSASHAASGLHNDHHAASNSIDHVSTGHKKVEVAPPSATGMCVTISETSDNEASSSQCCSGICLSVVLTENGTAFVEQALSGRYLTRHTQTASTDPTSFLRPPQYLI